MKTDTPVQFRVAVAHATSREEMIGRITPNPILAWVRSYALMEGHMVGS